MYYGPRIELKTFKNQYQSLVITPGGILPISYIGMCRPIEYGFCAVLVRKRVFTLPILVWGRVWFSRELRQIINVFIVSIPNE